MNDERTERNTLRRLQTAFSGQEWLPSEEEHPDAEKLWASAAGELDPTDDHLIMLHLSRCASCASSWRLAREMLSSAEITSIPNTSSVPQHRAWSHRLEVLAAAAVLMIGVGLGFLLINHSREPSRPVYRQQSQMIRIIASPATRIMPRSACRLRWDGGPTGTRYDLTVTGESLETICLAKGLMKPEYLVPAHRIPPSAHEILWRVTAHLPTGEIIRSETFRSALIDETCRQ